MKIKYSVIIPTYKHLEDCLKPCLESIIKYTDLNTYCVTDGSKVEVIVVANGCDDDTRNYVQDLRMQGLPFRLIWINKPLGYTKAINEGIRQADGEYIVLLNNDTVLLEQPKNQWLEILNLPFKQHRQQPRNIGANVFWYETSAGITGPMKTMCEAAGRKFLIFFCVMISKAVIDKIGLLDEIFSPGYGEDTDYCLKAEQAGFEVVQVPEEKQQYYADKRMTGEFPIYHAGNVTFKNWPDGDKLIERNNNILRERYNVSVKARKEMQNRLNNPDGTDGGTYNLDALEYWNRTAAKLGMMGSPTSLLPNIERAKKCDGFMSDEELMWLAQQAKTHKVIVEVGSWHGKSSRAIADNLPADGVLYCVDTWKGSKTEQETFHTSAKEMDGDAAYYEFLGNCWDLIQAGKIIPLRMTSENAALFLSLNKMRADMVFIDAGHTCPEVKDDLIHWAKVIKTGGTICGHDYLSDQNPTWMEVKKAVDEIFPHVKVAPNTSIWYHSLAGTPGMFAARMTTGGGSAIYKNSERIEGKPTLFHFPEEEPKYTTWLSKGSTLTYLDTEPKVFDCFPFFNELDILEIRLNELYDVVDRFVIVEARVTHGGQPKPLHWHEHHTEPRFAKFLHKITYKVVEEFPYGDSWTRERFQRNYIMQGLKDCKDNDIIIISDADEIPKAETIQRIKTQPKWDFDIEFITLGMDLYYYYFNCKSTERWDWSKVMTYKKLKELGSPSTARYYQSGVTRTNAGWHFSYFGGINAVIEKIKATAHQEYNNEQFTNPEAVKQKIEKGLDLFDRPLKYEWSDCFHKESYPKWIEKSDLFTKFVNMKKA